MSRRWSEEEISQLENLWGTKPISAIAKKFGRTVTAIQVKADRLKLGPALHGSSDIPFNQLILALGLNNSHSGIKQRLVKLGIPIKYRKVISSKFAVINITKFWSWAKKHQDDINFARFEENTLGIEPKWAKEKRKKDIDGGYLFRHQMWTPFEDSRLMMMLNQYKYTMYDITVALNRSRGSIQRRMDTLGLKQRPIRKEATWTAEEEQLLINLKESGMRFRDIANRVKRCESACRGKYSHMQRKLKEDLPNECAL